MTSNVPDSYVSYLPPVTDTIDMVYTEDKQSSMLNYTSPIVRGVVAVTLIAVVVGSFMYLSRRTSPWLDNGDNIYFTKGNVGIGTDSPGNKLEVAGGIMAKRDNFVRINVHDTRQGGLGWGIDQGGIDGPVNSFGIVQNGVAPRMVFLPNGNVGIGTNDPATKLHVEGNIVMPFGSSIGLPGYTYSQILLNDYADNQDTLHLQSGGNSPSKIVFRTGVPGSGLRTERMRITDSGNVGIGTNDPRAKLDVNGSLCVRTSTTNSSNRPALATSTIIPGEIRGLEGITSDHGFLRLSAGGADSTIAQSGIDITGYSTIPDMDTNISMYTQGQERLRINKDGDIKIGTFTSSYRHLQMGGGNSFGFLYGSFPGVGDGVNLSYNHYHDANGNIQFTNTVGGNAAIHVGYGSIWLKTGLNNVEPSPRLVVTSSGNVGIGITNPGTNLEVANAIRVRDGGYPEIQLANNDGNVKSELLWDNFNNKTVLRSYNEVLHFETSANVPSMVINTNGNVSFGPAVSTPNAIYHAGTVNVIGGGQRAVLRIENNGGVGSPTIIFGESGNFTEDVVPTIKKVQGTNNLAIMSSGNVGIGIMDPAKQLHVATQAVIGYRPGVSGGVLLAETAVYGIPAVQAIDSGFAAAHLTLNPVGGNVGIGTDDPKAKLHVQGSISDSFPWVQYWDSAGIVTGDENYAVSIYASNTVVADVFATVSDARIKKDLQNINDGDALAKLRLIEPTEYNYIDRVNKTTKRVYGFIAQQVREHFPEATVLSKDFIPDIYCLHAVDLALQTISVPSKARTGKLRIMTKTRQLDVEVTCPGPDVVQLPEGTLTEEHLHEGNVFVYGYEVEDFHTLNKDYLFTINFAATQELDRQVVQLKSENQGLRSELQALSTEKESLKTRLTTSETEVSGLRSELQALRDVLREKGLIE